MRPGRLLWFSLGALAGLYVVDRRRRNLAKEPPELVDAQGESLEPDLAELPGGECVPVIDVGKGPAIVLLPGLSGDSQVFRYQIAALSVAYRIIAPNLRTDFEGVERDFDQFAHDVAAVLDSRGIEKAVLLGLSFGGPIAIRFATLYPKRALGLILTNTLARLDLSHVGLNRTLFIPVARLFTRFAPAWLSRKMAPLWGRYGIWVFDPSVGNDEIIDYQLEVPVRIPLAVGNNRMDTFKNRDLRRDLRSIERPALVLVGAADTFTPIEWQREIAELLPNCEYVEIPFGGHLALLSHHEVFNRTVLDWLDRYCRDLPRAELSSSTETA